MIKNQDKVRAGKLGGKIGGKAKVLKGIAWLKVNDPKKYEETKLKISRSHKKRQDQV